MLASSRKRMSTEEEEGQAGIEKVQLEGEAPTGLETVQCMDNVTCIVNLLGDKMKYTVRFEICSLRVPLEYRVANLLANLGWVD